MAGHRALYGALLRLYPRSFREGYAELMSQLFADRLRDVGARAWLETAPDLVRTVPVQRMEAVMARLGPRARIVLPALGVLAAAVAAAAFGGGAIPLIVVVTAAVLILRRQGVASSVLGDRAPLWPAVIQAWWAPVAALLGVAMIALGVGTVFWAANLGGRIVGSTVLVAFGAAMLLGLMRRPFDRSTGNTIVLVATVPPLLVFWVIVPTVAAVVVWVGVLAGGFAAPRVAAARP
jgi:hypothetical protein